VNCISYFRGGDRPYLASGADDHKVRVWDYQTKACVATLDGHTNNISQKTHHKLQQARDNIGASILLMLMAAMLLFFLSLCAF